MKQKTVYCEECTEEIPNDEVYWDEKRLYCGRCGSEMELSPEAVTVFDAITSQKASRLLKLEYDDYDEDFEDEEEDDEEYIR